MNKISYRLACSFGILLAFSVILVPMFCQADDAYNSDVIRFGVFPYKSPKTIIEIYGPIVDRLEKKLGRKIKLISAPNVSSFLEKARNGEYDLLLSAPTVYFKLPPTEYKVIARGVPSFYGGAIVRKDSEIKTIEQLRGKKVAAIGEHGYAAYSFLLPQLQAKGINPRKEVAFQFLDKVDTIIYGVINKKFDAGLIRLDLLDLPAWAGIRDQLLVITRSPEIPQFPFVVKSSMDASIIIAIQEVLTALSPGRADELEILNSLQIKKIVTATDADYTQFYEQIKDMDYFRQP